MMLNITTMQPRFQRPNSEISHKLKHAKSSYVIKAPTQCNEHLSEEPKIYLLDCFYGLKYDVKTDHLAAKI